MQDSRIHELLNLNWGGPGFATYEGRLEDGDNEPMDADARADAALAAFSGDTDPDPDAPDPDAPDPNAPDPDAPDPNAPDPDAPDPNATTELTEEQLQADPRFVELTDFKDSVTNTLSEFGIPLDDKGNPDLNEAKAQLSDAAVLYSIMQGKGTPSQLLDTMSQNAGWTAAQKEGIAQDLIGWLTKAGYLKDGAAADGKKPAGNLKDPLAEKVDKILSDRDQEKAEAKQAEVKAHQKKIFDENFLPTVDKFCKQKGIPAEDTTNYKVRIAEAIAGNKAILARIEKGNYVDVQRLFTKIYNEEVARLQRWTKSQTAAAKGKEKQPRIPAGGAPPAPGSAKKIDAKNRDERIAAATEML